MSLALILTLGGALTACHKEEQAVVGAAKKAVSAEQQAQAKAQAKATTREEQRVALSRIPLPTKSQYVNVHEPSAWANPFLSVGAETIDLRIVLADANTSEVGQGTMLRPEAARRQELQLRPADLADAVVRFLRSVALRPGDRGRRDSRSQCEGPAEDSAERGGCHSAAQRFGDCCGRVAYAVEASRAGSATIPP